MPTSQDVQSGPEWFRADLATKASTTSANANATIASIHAIDGSDAHCRTADSAVPVSEGDQPCSAAHVKRSLMAICAAHAPPMAAAASDPTVQETHARTPDPKPPNLIVMLMAPLSHVVFF
ncbi:hypothetical protein [Bifidobacterium callitrichos]|uniref:hypothetical protein n=1 Tax=Bifidobacterium callitrichos TaxID=762209 RepID=UPI001CC32AD7|nr:hypothetical protein [Bifidobacterium callitrichos]